jgi:two-component system, chemotaxis family, response regulator Rcp1
MKQASGTKQVEILLVEDNPADVRLIREALKESKILNNLSVVEDGVEAMDFLKKKGKYASSVRPDLILLDLNLPRKNGREVLAEVKSDEKLKRIPVVIMTVSDDEKDILISYNSHANCYIKKPLDFDQFNQVVQAIENFWFTIVCLPPDGKKEK